MKLDELVAALFYFREKRLAALDAMCERNGKWVKVSPDPADVLGNVLDFVEGRGRKWQYYRYVRPDPVVPGWKLLSQILDLRLAVQFREGYDAVLGRLHAVIVAISIGFGNSGMWVCILLPLVLQVVWSVTAWPETALEFESRFATEEACRQYLYELRWPNGFQCPRCDGSKAWTTKRGPYRCSQCDYQASVTAGTIF